MTKRHRIDSDKRAIVRAVVTIAVIIMFACNGWCQEKRTKIRISNAGFTLTALPLLAAKDWGVFSANGLDVELIVMSPTLAAAAVAQGDIDYVAGVGPASVAATLSGLPSRAIWFSSDRITYWLQSAPPYKTLQDLKGKKIALSGGVGGTIFVGGSGGSGGIAIPDASNDGFISTPSDAGCAELRDAASSDPADAGPDSGVCPDGTRARDDALWETQCGLRPGGYGCGGPLAVLVFDANGVLTSIESAEPGVPLRDDVAACLKLFLATSCYPSLACTRQILGSHCWVA